MKHGFFPIGSWFDIPHAYPCENNAPSQFICHEHSWLGYLIKYAYLHNEKIQYVCRMPRYTIGDHFNPKHNTTKSMVGILPLAPHHDSLQYIHHVHLMQRGQN